MNYKKSKNSIQLSSLVSQELLPDDHDFCPFFSGFGPLCIALLDKAKFQARKWSSNSKILLEGIDPANHGLTKAMVLGDSKGVKVLGISWNPTTDSFYFNVKHSVLEHTTKCTVLSLFAKLFNPMGWISPIIVVGKLFMQQLWKEKYFWDTLLPQKLILSIAKYFNSLLQLVNLPIPRWTGFSLEIIDAQLHGFPDASAQAYGAVVYFRVEYHQEKQLYLF